MIKTKPMPTRERLQELLSYDPETGIFIWKVFRGGTAKAGVVAGSTKNGYSTIGVDGTRYHASRLAWVYMTGEAPEHDIDHRNRDKSFNAFANLRPATRAENCGNQKVRKNNELQLKGVRMRKATGKFDARITKDYTTHHLGQFDTAEEAARAYDAAAKSHHGEFARLNFPGE